ncbi:DUF6308 family protein [Terrabacter lapilli]
MLSVNVSPRSALELLVTQRHQFEVLLGTVGPDRDLVDEASVAEREL